MRKGLFICVELSGSTKLYLFYFVVVFCWRCDPDIVFFFFVVDPCCCKTENMNGCFVFVVVVPILGFIFVMF